MRSLNILRALRLLTWIFLVAAIVVFIFAAILGGLFFDYDAVKIGSLFLFTLIAAVVLFMIAAIVVFLIWLFFSRPIILMWLVLGLLLVGGAVYVFITLILDQPIYNIGELLEPFLSFLGGK